MNPQDCLIIEDSHLGKEDALNSGSFLCEVSSPHDVSYELIKNHLEKMGQKNKIKWNGKDINIVIPMAGLGSRFKIQVILFQNH